MLIHSLLFLVSSALASPQSSRTAATDEVKKQVLKGDNSMLIAASEEDLPFRDSTFYRVRNMSSSQGWLVWVNLHNDEAHLVIPPKSFKAFLGEIEKPLSSVRLKANDLTDAKKVSYLLLHLAGNSNNSVECAAKAKDAICTVTSKIGNGANEVTKLLFQTEKNKISIQ